jgi:hypothetical protein
MIDWTDELIARVGSFSRAALSYTGVDGYPVALPAPFTFDPTQHHFTLPKPPHRPGIARPDHASLTLVGYTPAQGGRTPYLVFQGQLAEEGDAWLFTPSRVVLSQWGRR